MTTRTVGKGAIWYLGTLLDEATMQRVLAAIEGEAGLPDARFDLPEGVELCVQRKPGQRGSGSEVLILINHNETSQTIKLPGRFRSIITDKSGLTSLELPAQGVEVLTEEGIR